MEDKPVTRIRLVVSKFSECRVFPPRKATNDDLSSLHVPRRGSQEMPRPSCKRYYPTDVLSPLPIRVTV